MDLIGKSIQLYKPSILDMNECPEEMAHVIVEGCPPIDCSNCS